MQADMRYAKILYIPVGLRPVGKHAVRYDGKYCIRKLYCQETDRVTNSFWLVIYIYLLYILYVNMMYRIYELRT